MNKLILSVLAVTIFVATGCSKDSENSAIPATQGFASKGEAEAASPTGLSCVRVEQVPISRGRGTGLEGKFNEVTYYYPGFLRGDINSDGLINRDDAMLAVHKLFKPENFKCPRTADVAGYPQTLVPDGFFTAQDVYVWNEFKNSGTLSWPQDVICGYDCPIPNHMQP